jgi:nitrogen PTS system EIIA component
LGRRVAIPHARVKGLRQAGAAFARLRIPIAFDAPDAKPVADMVVLLAPAQANDEHLKMLAIVAEMFCDTNFRATLRSTADPNGIHCPLTSWSPP